jgi:hypothetical protein
MFGESSPTQGATKMKDSKSTKPPSQAKAGAQKHAAPQAGRSTARAPSAKPATHGKASSTHK